MKRLLAILGAAVLAFVGFTAWALESGGVAVVETHAADGSLRSTHVWFAEPDGELWVEAGTPENGWFVDVERDPRIRFSAERRSGHYLAERVRPDAHDEIRALLRAKYGVRDWWIDLLFDTSRSVAVRLVPVPEGG